jgi:hypothetical protein
MSAASQIRRLLRYDYAVYWPVAGRDDMGMPKVGDPVEVNCRWEDGSEQTVTVDKVERMAKATVYVDRDMVTGGYLWHGRKADLAKPKPPPKDAIPIAAFMSIPDRKNRAKLRYALL